MQFPLITRTAGDGDTFGCFPRRVSLWIHKLFWLALTKFIFFFSCRVVGLDGNGGILFSDGLQDVVLCIGLCDGGDPRLHSLDWWLSFPPWTLDPVSSFSPLGIKQMVIFCLKFVNCVIADNICLFVRGMFEFWFWLISLGGWLLLWLIFMWTSWLLLYVFQLSQLLAMDFKIFWWLLLLNPTHL